MKISRLISALLLLCLFSISFVYSQGDSKKDKLKDDKFVPQSVQVKANLLVLDENGKLSDIKLEDLKVFEDGVEQKITYFAKKEDALNIGLVIDNSASLRGIFDDLILAGSTAVASLKPEDEAFLIRFVSSEKINVLQNWTSDKEKLNLQIKDMFFEGGQTAVIDAVYLAAQKILEREKQAKSKRYALLLITDGIEASSYYNLNQLLELFKDTDVQIFSLSFPAEQAFKEIKEYTKKLPDQKKRKKPLMLNNILALETGGTAYTLPIGYTKENIAEALKKFASELRSQYVIGYTSTNQKRNDKPRSLRIEIASNQQRGFIRESFVAPKDID